MKLRKESGEVYYLADLPPRLRLVELRHLVARAQRGKRKRARFCLHAHIKDRIHEMIVVVQPGGYIAPHRHRSKVESYHVIQGRADLVLFDKSGGIERVVPMGPPASGLCFVCRVPRNQYHCFVLRRTPYIFHEVTNGPFHRAHTKRAPWAPDEANRRLARLYSRSLAHRVARAQRDRA